MSEWPELMGKAEFARKVLNRSPSVVTDLKDEGRLVLEGTGRHAKVRVAETLALMAKTKGGRDDVAARHAENAGSAIPEPPRGGENAPEVACDVVVDIREERARAELRKSRAQAEQEEMAAAKMRRELIEIEVSDAAMREVGATLRGLLDVFPDQVAPLVASVTTLEEAHEILADQVRELADRFGAALARKKVELSKGART